MNCDFVAALALGELMVCDHLVQMDRVAAVKAVEGEGPVGLN